MRNAIKLAVLLWALPAAAAALEVTGTAPASVKGAAKADFFLSGLAVKGVSFEGGAVVLPVSQVNDRVYSDVKLLSRALYGKLETCFRSGCARPGRAAAPAVKLEELKPLKSKSRVANAEVSFDGDLLVVLGVMASYRDPDEFWVAFPASVEFRDAGLKAAVERTVREAWARSQAKK